MSIETIAAVIFLFLLTLFLIKNREKLQIQKIIFPILYFAMYRTKLGIKQMDTISKKHPKLVDVLSKIGVFIGILGMLLIAWTLIKSLATQFLVPETAAGVALVLPFKVKGGFFVPFFYWIISIFFIAVIHEFSHGVVARLHNIPIKSSGFAFLNVIIPVIPAAFVEPDERILSKKKRLQKLSVFAAGPFSNLLSGAIFLIMFLLLAAPVASKVLDFDGVKVEGYTEGNSSAKEAGIMQGSVIKKIDGVEILTVNNLSESLEAKKPGDLVHVETTNGSFSVSLGKNPQNESEPYLGVLISQNQKIKPSFEEKYGKFSAPTILWIMGLLYWLYLLSIGIGLFNLVPIGPIDGGQMSREIFRQIFKKEETALKVWGWTSTFFFFIIIFSIFSGFF